MKFGFDERGEVQIEGYFARRNNVEFSADELRTLYLLASWESEVWHKDKPAARLLQQYAAQCGMGWGFNSPSSEKVYFPDRVSLVRTLGNKTERGWDEVEITGDPCGDLPELSEGPGSVISTRYDPEGIKSVDKGREGPFLWLEERKLKHELARSHEDIFAWDGAGRGSLSHELFPVLESRTVERGAWVSRTIPVPHDQLEGLREEIKGMVNSEYNEPTVVSLQPKFLGVLKRGAGRVKLARALVLLNAVSLTRSEVTSSSEGSQRE